MPTVILTESEVEQLLRPVTGDGGWQRLTRTLQERLTETNEITITENEINRLRRYVEDYGGGGWEIRLGGVLNALRRSGITI